MKKTVLLFLSLLIGTGLFAQTPFKTLNYLYQIKGSQTVSGIHNREPNSNPDQWSDWINGVTGHYPGLWSGDFLFQQENIDNRWTMIYEAEEQWNAGAMINIMAHVCPPTQGAACQWTGGVVSDLTDSQWNELITNGTNLNNVWKSRLDDYAVYLQYLEDKGVEVMFRPFHEMNQGVFWWAGRTGPNGTSRLFQITRDYLEDQKGLSNLIWIWNVQDFGSLSSDINNYDPGSDYWDIVSLDMYSSDGTGYTTAKYNTLKNKANGKPMAIGECQVYPTLSELSAQPDWGFFMGWSELVQQNQSNAQIQTLFSAQNIVVRDEMPGWGTVINEPNIALNKQAFASSTETGSSNTVAMVTDGNATTRWSSVYTDPQWIYVDLGNTFQVNRIVLNWEAAAGSAYQIQTSNNATTWTTIFTEANGNGGIDDLTVNGVGRYVRMYGTQRNTQWGYSLWAFDVYGTQANIPVLTTITISPTNPSISVGTTQQFTALGFDQNGNAFPTNFTWSATGGNIGANGLFTGSTAGTFTVTATSGNVSKATQVTVTSVSTGTNLALNKQAIASSTEAGSTNTASKATDGSTSTRWSSVYTDPQWIYVDLGNTFQVNRVVFNWEAAAGIAYQIQTSNNASTWTTIFTEVNGNGGMDDINVSGTGRYVRMYGTKRNTQWGYSLWEFQVYGTQANIPVLTTITISPTNTSISVGATKQFTAQGFDQNGNAFPTNFTWSATGGNIGTNGLYTGSTAGTFSVTATSGSVSKSTQVTVTPVANVTNLALSKQTFVSSTEAGGNVGARAVDGSASTRWSSVYSDPQWIYVDLQSSATINRIVLNWEAAAGIAYQIQTSNNATTWTTIYTEANGNGGMDDINVSGTGRYVRMYGTKRNSLWGYSLWEFEVYGTAGEVVSNNDFKVVGYFPTWSGDVNSIQYSKLTHINYSFILPTSSGGITGLDNPSRLTQLVNNAHTNGVKVCIAVGGWNDGNDSAFESLASNSGTRTTFVNNLMNFVATYNLDGVDIDWEYPDPGNSGNNYTLMMTQLAQALHAQGKILTAAVVAEGGTGAGVQSAVFGQVDFLNIMAYDGGTPHSTFNYAVSSLNYWLGRGLPKAKAVLGVPFYGRDPYMSYAQLVASDAGAPFKDQVGNVYYNGIATIQSKTTHAIQNAGGIMIWELTQDISGQNSLLTAINNRINASSARLTNELPETAWTESEINVYPNPSLGKDIHFSTNVDKQSKTANVKMISMLGQIVYENNINVEDGRIESILLTKKFIPGIYVLHVTAGTTIRKSTVAIQ